jgi:exopolysaccharide biosynthesis polyprenyl glycosylphosphotransferase
VDALLTHHALSSVDRIVITVPPGAADRVAQLVERLSVLPHEISLIVDRADDRVMGRIGAKSLAQLGGRRRAMGQALVKRAFDLFVAVTALVLLSPALVLIAVAVALDSPGPVFFRQTRHGFNNEAFRVWKFRSMRVEASDATASRQVSAGDARITRVGRIIRSTSLDELPQLFNILTGEMSLVGPRPHAIGMRSGDGDAASLIAVYCQRHRLKPGLTGWAAVNGSRGPVDDLESLQRRLKLDLEYIERQSFWLDIQIMLRTLPLVLGDTETAR